VSNLGSSAASVTLLGQPITRWNQRIELLKNGKRMVGYVEKEVAGKTIVMIQADLSCSGSTSADLPMLPPRRNAVAFSDNEEPSRNGELLIGIVISER